MAGTRRSWWDLALDGRLHHVNVLATSFRTLASLKAAFYREASDRYLQVVTHVPRFSQDLYIQAWTPLKEGYVDHAPAIKNRTDGSMELPDYYGFIGRERSPELQARAAGASEAGWAKQDIEARIRSSQEDIPLELLLPPCSCGLGLRSVAPHPATCRVWGLQRDPPVDPGPDAGT